MTTRNTETEIPDAEQIIAAANEAIDEAVNLFAGAEIYKSATVDRESTLCYLLRSLYVAGMTAEAARRYVID